MPSVRMLSALLRLRNPTSYCCLLVFPSSLLRSIICCATILPLTWSLLNLLRLRLVGALQKSDKAATAVAFLRSNAADNTHAAILVSNAALPAHILPREDRQNTMQQLLKEELGRIQTIRLVHHNTKLNVSPLLNPHAPGAKKSQTLVLVRIINRHST